MNIEELNIVQVSQTPLAAAPWEITSCLKKYGNLKVRLIQSVHAFVNGMSFPKDLIIDLDQTEVINIIQKADLVHIHDTCPDELIPYLKGKKVIIQFHSVPKKHDFAKMNALTSHRFTVEQPMQVATYSYPTLPNMIDVEAYSPKQTINDIPKIVFAPTNGRAMNVPGSKARNEVQGILNKFAGTFTLDIFDNLSYFENLARKRSADILIDDVLNCTFNRTALEGACFGLVVMTSLVGTGFMFTTLANLEDNLIKLRDNMKIMENYKEASRAWVLKHWHPGNQVNQYIDQYKRILNG